MKKELEDKIKNNFQGLVILKDSDKTKPLFAGRNLPAFVKDFVLKRYVTADGEIEEMLLTSFLDNTIPQGSIKEKLMGGCEPVTILTRFIVYIDLIKNRYRFSVPDSGIKLQEGVIPEYVVAKHREELTDGEMWGVIKICLVQNDDGKDFHVEMVDFKPFKPYKSVDLDFYCNARKNFSTTEWIDFLLSAMEYEADGFDGITQKLEFLSRLLIFVEPRLNVIELAPKGTGKSYVFGNISKHGWLVSGGKVTRAKLFYDKQRQQNGIIKNHDFVAFDEIQTIEFQERAEIQAALKSYLESGKTTIDNNEFSSECGLMIMGNIPLDNQNRPKSNRYFDTLPISFKESALLDRFHCFIEGWYLPRLKSDMLFKGWSLNMEYFSEILHSLRTQNRYAILFNQITEFESGAAIRDKNAITRTATAYMKLLFPHWQKPEDVDIEEFKRYCLEPAKRRREIIMQQCGYIDQEFKNFKMPEVEVKL